MADNIKTFITVDMLDGVARQQVKALEEYVEASLGIERRRRTELQSRFDALEERVNRLQTQRATCCDRVEQERDLLLRERDDARQRVIRAAEALAREPHPRRDILAILNGESE